MPESRDRLLRRRPDDATLFFPRPIHSTSLYIQPDEPEVSTFRWGSTTLNGSTIGVAASNPGRVNGVSRGSFGTPSPRRPGNGRRGGTGTVRRRPRRSLLLSWYPRKTLQDITPIVKENIHVEEVFEKLKCTEAGLTSDEVQKRLEVFGYNKLEEKKLWNLIVSTKGFCASFQRACLQRQPCGCGMSFFYEMVQMFFSM